MAVDEGHERLGLNLPATAILCFHQTLDSLLLSSFPPLPAGTHFLHTLAAGCGLGKLKSQFPAVSTPLLYL